jgi:hypothetical protein
MFDGGIALMKRAVLARPAIRCPLWDPERLAGLATGRGSRCSDVVTRSNIQLSTGTIF